MADVVYSAPADCPGSGRGGGTETSDRACPRLQVHAAAAQLLARLLLQLGADALAPALPKDHRLAHDLWLHAGELEPHRRLVEGDDRIQLLQGELGGVEPGDLVDELALALQEA